MSCSGEKITLPSDADLDGVRAFQFTDSADKVVSVDGEGNVAGAALDGNGTLQYHKKTTDITRGDFEDNDVNGGDSSTDTGLRQDIGIPEINLELKSEPIVAKTRKLKAVWTPELAQDLNAYHSIDAEAELTSLLSEYVSMEIDLEILDMLLVNAHSTSSFDNNK